MIAICQPAPAESGAAPRPGDRTGSLRRIDDIVSELLAGYSLAAEAGTQTELRPQGVGAPCTAADLAAWDNLPLEPQASGLRSPAPV